jgi:hypothetical protein
MRTRCEPLVDGRMDGDDGEDDDGSDDGGGGGGGDKRDAKKSSRKRYTVSANKILKAAQLSAKSATKATEFRVSAVKQADDARKAANEQARTAQLVGLALFTTLFAVKTHSIDDSRQYGMFHVSNLTPGSECKPSSWRGRRRRLAPPAR